MKKLIAIIIAITIAVPQQAYALRPMASEAKISAVDENAVGVKNNTPAAKKNVSFSRKITEAIFIAAILTAVFITLFATYEYYLAFRQFCMLLSTMTISFISYSVGDFIRQRINMTWGPQLKMDYKHVLRCGLFMSIIAGFFNGFLWHDLCLTAEGAERAAKAIIDQGVINPIYFSPFSLSMGKFLIEEKPFHVAVKKSMQEWSMVIPFCLVYWVPVLVIVYIIFQPATPILWIYIAALIWSVPSTYFINLEQKENLQKIERNLKIFTKTMQYLIPATFSILAISIFYQLWPLTLMCTLAILWPVFFKYYVHKILAEEIRQVEETGQAAVLSSHTGPSTVSATSLALRESLHEESISVPAIELPGCGRGALPALTQDLLLQEAA